MVQVYEFLCECQTDTTSFIFPYQGVINLVKTIKDVCYFICRYPFPRVLYYDLKPYFRVFIFSDSWSLHYHLDAAARRCKFKRIGQ